MKILWATDIHLTFTNTKTINIFLDKIVNSDADVLLLAGDIAEGTSIINWLQRLHNEITIPIYFVLGNHDFYGSSIFSVSKDVSKLCAKTNNLRWLSELNYIKLTDQTALIGHDGWYDAQNGNIYSGVLLNDFRFVGELSPFIGNVNMIANRCKEVAELATKHIKKSLKSSLKTFNNVIMITHVPPFEETTWHEGSISDSSFLPWFSSKMMGEALVHIMNNNKDKNLTVLCGHTHSDGVVNVLPNLKVITGKATYYYPDIQEILNVV